jgi:hypothetical protein
VQNALVFPTNRELNGFANLVGPKPKTGTFTDSGGDVNMFQNPGAAISAFDFPFLAKWDNATTSGDPVTSA